METYWEQVQQLHDQLTHVAISCLGKDPFDRDKAKFTIAVLDGPMEGEIVTVEMRIV